MNASRWLAAFVVLLSVAAAADAQFHSPYGGPRGHYGYGGGFSYSRVRGRGSLSFGVSFGRGGYFCPPFYAAPCYPHGITSTRVTIVTIAPPPPPLYLFPPPGSFLDDLPPDLLPRRRQLDQVPVPDLPPIPPIPQVPRDDKPQAPEKKAEEKPKKDAGKPAPKPKPPEPEPDEYSRLMKAGLELFDQQQYGRAAARFRQAAQLEPAQPLPLFLLAQALLEQGRYDDARDALVEGLRRKPDWPVGKFRPQELYGQNPEDYTELLLTLERVQSKLPNDPVLLLLRGYALWFDGQKDQAAALFRRALKGPDRAAVERFMAALPDEAL
jgi:hypothetical protein